MGWCCSSHALLLNAFLLWRSIIPFPELTWQLRGWAGDRQVPNVKYALQHNIGLGGAVVITLYRKLNNKKTEPRVGYNPVRNYFILRDRLIGEEGGLAVLLL